MEIKYPFTPKSNRHLMPGQFWGIKLKSGKYACGRVLDVADKSYPSSPTKSFLAGLMDWTSDIPPTANDIQDKKILECAVAHVKTIAFTGGSILGCTPLKNKDSFNINSVEKWMGYDFIVALAEKHLG